MVDTRVRRGDKCVAKTRGKALNLSCVEHKMLIINFSLSSNLLRLNSASPSLALPVFKLTRISLFNSVYASSCTPFAFFPSIFYPKQHGGGGLRRKWKTLHNTGENQSVTVALPAVDSAAEVVRNFYGGINAHDVDSVEELIAQNCVYEDLVFPRPFVGRKEILEFFKKFTNSTSRDLQFVIDDLSTEDNSLVGVIWHLEWKEKPFPFSKGCSFYRLEVINGKRQITYGRDSVEPAIKPGDSVLVVIRSLTWLLQQFPQLADWL